MTPFLRERLRCDHRLGDFSCGVDPLDTWLRQAALGADRSGTARTYLWVDGDGAIVAYFSLAPHVVRRQEVPARVGRGSPDAIPAVLLARLALASPWQGHADRLGSVLLLDALSVAVDAIRRAGGRLIVVDAIDDRARRFYEHHGFVAATPDGRRLVVKASDAARALGLERP